MVTGKSFHIIGLLSIITLCWSCSDDPSGDNQTTTIRIAEQFGIGYLPLQMIREHSLLEKHGELQNIYLTVEWLQFSSGSEMNVALFAEDLDIASGGITPLLSAWDETMNSHKIKGIACLNEMPLYLNTNQPDVHSLEDIDEDDRIALPSVEVSIQARTLQMAVEQAGLPFNALDHLTVAMSHPDGLTALTSLNPEITGHFTSPPFMYQELDNEEPQIHRLISSYDILGGPSTFNCVWTAEHFREENQAAYKAFLGALEEAMEMITADKDAAADVYIRQTGSGLDPAFIREIVNNSEITFTLAPANSMKYAEFMYRIDAIANQPNSWKDYFFDDIHHLGGS